MAKDKKGKGSGTKDACYHKVKSRYSVWPSAYASGALVKCRKVGAANWGNKSESFEIDPKKHKAAQKNQKIRNMMKSPNENEAKVAKKKVKGPELPMEQYTEEGYKPIDKKKENEMYRRAGNLARTSLSSKGKKKLETAKKSATIVSAISSQKEDERFAKMADEKARSNYSESRDPLVQKILDEAGKKCWKGYKKAGTQTLFGKTYNRCVKA